MAGNPALERVLEYRNRRFLGATGFASPVLAMAKALAEPGRTSGTRISKHVFKKLPRRSFDTRQVGRPGDMG
jgi:hypothetical protein